MSWDLGEPELILNVAENEKIISSLREQLAAETEREEAQRRQPDYAAEKEEVRSINILITATLIVSVDPQNY
jgi:hypothetical protein